MTRWLWYEDKGGGGSLTDLRIEERDEREGGRRRKGEGKGEKRRRSVYMYTCLYTWSISLLGISRSTTVPTST